MSLNVLFKQFMRKVRLKCKFAIIHLIVTDYFLKILLLLKKNFSNKEDKTKR